MQLPACFDRSFASPAYHLRTEFEQRASRSTAFFSPSHACILRVYRIDRDEASEKEKGDREKFPRKFSISFFSFTNYSFILRNEKDWNWNEYSRKSSYVKATHNAYFVYDTKARNPPLISRQAGAVPRLSSSSVRLDDNPRPLWVERASKVRICNGIPSPPISDVNWAPTQQQSIPTKFGA